MDNSQLTRGPFICPNCNKEFKQFSIFNAHSKEKCSSELQTPFCIIYNPTNPKNGKSNKKLHLTVEQYFYGHCEGKEKAKQVSSNIKNFRCYSCSKVLRSNLRFMSHVRHKVENEKQQNDSVNDFNICGHCHRHYDSPFQLQCHMETVHSSVPASTTCCICELNFQEEQDFLYHMKDKHKYQEMPYICRICHFRSSRYTHLFQHFRQTHDNTNALLCQFCLCVHNTPNSFLKHTIQHMKKSLRCPSCRLQFVNRVDRNEHIRRHHETVLNPNNQNALPTNVNNYTIYVKLDANQEPVHGSTDTQSTSKSMTSFAVRGIKRKLPLKNPTIFQNSKKWKINCVLDKSLHLAYFKCWECEGKMLHTEYAYNQHFSVEYNCPDCTYTTHCRAAAGKHMEIMHYGNNSPDRLRQLQNQSTKTSTVGGSPSTRPKRKLPSYTPPHNPELHTKRLKLQIEKIPTAVNLAMNDSRRESDSSKAKHSRKQPNPQKLATELQASPQRRRPPDNFIAGPTPATNGSPSKTPNLTTPSHPIGQSLAPMDTFKHDPHHPFKHTPRKPRFNHRKRKIRTYAPPPTMVGSTFFKLNGDFASKCDLTRTTNTFQYNAFKPSASKTTISTYFTMPLSSSGGVMASSRALTQKLYNPNVDVNDNVLKRQATRKGKNLTRISAENVKPPSSMRFAEVTKSSFIVEWSPPNCSVSKYQLEFKGFGLPTTQSLPSGQRSVRLVGLRSNTTYLVKMQSVCGEFCSSFIEGSQKTLALRERNLNAKPLNNVDLIVLDDDDELGPTKPTQPQLPPPHTPTPPMNQTSDDHKTPTPQNRPASAGKIPRSVIKLPTSDPTHLLPNSATSPISMTARKVGVGAIRLANLNQTQPTSSKHDLSTLLPLKLVAEREKEKKLKSDEPSDEVSDVSVNEIASQKQTILSALSLAKKSASSLQNQIMKSVATISVLLPVETQTAATTTECDADSVPIVQDTPDNPVSQSISDDATEDAATEDAATEDAATEDAATEDAATEDAATFTRKDTSTIRPIKPTELPENIETSCDSNKEEVELSSNVSITENSAVLSKADQSQHSDTAVKTQLVTNDSAQKDNCSNNVSETKPESATLNSNDHKTNVVLPEAISEELSAEALDDRSTEKKVPDSSAGTESAVQLCSTETTKNRQEIEIDKMIDRAPADEQDSSDDVLTVIKSDEPPEGRKEERALMTDNVENECSLDDLDELLRHV